MNSLTPPRSRAGTPSRSRTPSPSTLSLRNLKLRVRAGPAYDRSTHVNVNVNDPNAPTEINSENFTGHIVVRVKDFNGVPGEHGVISEDEEYFSETKDTYSIMFGGWFHHNGKSYSVEDIVFGNDFDESIAEKLPPGTSLGLKALSYIDPALKTDLFAPKPWAYSPLLATVNALQVTEDEHNIEKVPKLTRLHESTTLQPLDSSKPSHKSITSTAERRKWLTSHETRESLAFPSTYIAGDFSNPFVDFNTFSVLLPYVGLKVDVLKYWIKGTKRQPLRYVCRTRPKDGEEGVVFFVILFELVGDGIVLHDESMESGKEGNGYHSSSETGSRHSKESTPDTQDLGVD